MRWTIYKYLAPYRRLCFTGKWGDERVGFLGGKHDISLIKSQGCLRKFNVIHELMHLLGFWHEQQREDRDTYVTINTTNVINRELTHLELTR